MDHMILGLLILRSRSIYELQQCMEAGLNFMYGSSLGSIQAALKWRAWIEYYRHLPNFLQKK